MRLDTLNYRYKMKTELSKISEVLYREQEKYFVSKGCQPADFVEGCEVTIWVPSKMGVAQVPASLVLSKLTSDLIELRTSYKEGEIIQRYQLNATQDQETQVIYSEQNTFNHNRNQYNFIFLSLIYKIFYNRGIKKRMKYLENLCQI